MVTSSFYVFVVFFFFSFLLFFFVFFFLWSFSFFSSFFFVFIVKHVCPSPLSQATVAYAQDTGRLQDVPRCPKMFQNVPVTQKKLVPLWKTFPSSSPSPHGPPPHGPPPHPPHPPSRSLSSLFFLSFSFLFPSFFFLFFFLNFSVGRSVILHPPPPANCAC